MRHEVISADQPGTQVLFLPMIDVGERQVLTAAPNLSVAEMVDLALIGKPRASRDRIRVTIGAYVIERRNWSKVRPRLGWTVIIRLVPQGDNLRSILSVAVLVAAVALGQFYAPAIAGSITGSLFGSGITGFAGAAAASAGTISAVGSLLTAGVAIAGSLLINAFVPVRGLANQDAATSVYGITGLQNSANPGGVVPSVLGAHRYAGPYAATPYTENVGDDQYAIATILFGHGPLTFTNIRLGDTPISQFKDVELQIREGYLADAPITLHPQQVIEEQLSVQLVSTDAPSIRYTARDAAECSIDFAFAQGLVQYTKEGERVYTSVQFRIRYRKIGDVDFTLQSTPNISANEQKIIRRTVRWSFPTRGQYEVEVLRLTPEPTDNQIQSRSDWSCIRSFRPESPFNFKMPVAMIAVRMRASNQLNGIINNLNADCTLRCLDWDSPTQTWIVRATSNPASLFRHVLQGPANAYPKTDDQIDLVGLQQWHEYCASKALTYNRVHDYNGSRLDVLADIAAAGRATPHDDGARWGVNVDKPRTTYVSAVTPRNSWDYQCDVPYVQFPDGHRVKFIDATNGYQQAERIVPFPGVDPANVNVTEEMAHPGITDPATIYRETRRRQFELIHRPVVHTFNMDVESLVFKRGDLVPLNHDLIDRNQVAARVVAINGQDVAIDTTVEMEIGQGYACSIRLADGSSIRRTVVSVPGETTVLHLVGDLTGVQDGNLASFGNSVGGPVTDVVIKSIERGENLTAKVTAIDAAPQIDALVDAIVVPAWDGRVGEVLDLSAVPPAVPKIVRATSDDSLVLNVYLAPGTGSAVLPASYVVSYRLSGGGAYSTTTVPASQAVANISGFAAETNVDLKVRGVSSTGAASADSAVTTVKVQSVPLADTTNITADSTLVTADKV